jgi:hypothetical protein
MEGAILMATFTLNKINTDVFPLLNKALKRAIFNSTNVIGRKANKTVSQDMKKEYNIPPRVTKIGKNIILSTASPKDPNFKIRVKSAPRGVFKFPHRQTAAGLEVEIRRGKRQLIKGAFIAPLRKGQTGALRLGTFKRRDEKGNIFAYVRSKSKGRITRYTRKGTPYSAERRKVIFGFDIRDVYGSKFGIGKVRKVVENDYQKTLDEKFIKQVLK